MIEIFTSKGTLREVASYTDKELAALDGPTKVRFEKLRAVVSETERVEAMLAEEQRRVETLVRDRAAAIAELQRLAPRPTFLDQWKQAFKS